jgi:hypothetical protein
MGNSVKYNAGATEPFSLKKGNFYIGTGDVQKGPSNFWNTVTPPTGGYTIYLNKPSNGPSIYAANNDTELIFITNQIAGTNYTTAAQCLTYYAGQTDKVVFNRDYEEIITSGLVFYFDAGFTPSYPRSGNSWYDLSGTNDGSLTNGPTYNSGNSGSIVFDGTDDHIDTNFGTNFSTSDFTLYSWVYPEFDSDSYGRPIITKNGNGGCGIYDFALEYGRSPNKFSLIMDGGTGNPSLYTTSFPKNNWYNVVATREYLGGNNYKCTIYINGTSNATVTGNFTGGNATKTTIGKFIDCGPVGTWLGKISVTGIYSRALSSNEVISNYDAQKTRFGLM